MSRRIYRRSYYRNLYGTYISRHGRNIWRGINVILFLGILFLCGGAAYYSAINIGLSEAFLMGGIAGIIAIVPSLVLYIIFA